MLQNLISSVLTFLLALIPVGSTQVASLPKDEVTILFTGDVMLGRSVMAESLDQNDNFYPFRKVSDFLKNADITYVNLENPITNGCKRHIGGFTFCTTPDIVKGLQDSGVDIVSLANNHSGNYGSEGLEETRGHLDGLGVKWVDGNNLEILEVDGTKFGFLGFDYVYKGLNQKDIDLVKESDLKVDVLIIVPHWGEEYKAVANRFQSETAKLMIDAGADAIVGSHPHWPQNYEEYQGKPIYYSLGNFIFDQMWSEETKRGLIVKMTFEGKDLIKKEEFKTYMPKIGQPEIIRE